MLRIHGRRDVALICAERIDTELARALRSVGAVLWFCGPEVPLELEEATPEHAHRQLLASSWTALNAQLRAALRDLLGEAIPA
jgi:hypothetical protein